MRYIIPLLAALLLNIPLIRADEYIDRLDSAIAQGDKFTGMKEARIDSLKRLVAVTHNHEQLYVLHKGLVNEYMNYSLDSALIYAKRAEKIADDSDDKLMQADANMTVANIYNTVLMSKDAYDILQGIDHRSMHDELLSQYYILALQIYSNLAKQTFDADMRSHYRASAQAYRDSALAYNPRNEIVMANKYIAEGNYEMARQVVFLNDGKTSTDAAARYHVLAHISQLQHNTPMQKKYLAQAAYCDMVNGVREYMALQELAQILYNEGDISRAYRYMHRSISDAIACNARSRMLEMSKTIPIIDADYNRKQADTNFKLYVACTFVGILSVLLLASTIYVQTRNRKLSQAKQLQEQLNRQLEQSNNEQQMLNTKLIDANQQLETLNQKLQQTNSIKEEYISQFVTLCSEYLSKMESYRTNLQKIAAQRNFDQLYDAIKSTRQLDKELDDFYDTFDKAFLHLFPAFVDEFNKLLLPECRIKLKNGERLNTELRIFALQRLGINDSERVAGFLRCSFSTIYNYRTKMKNRAINRDNFENQIAGLC